MSDQKETICDAKQNCPHIGCKSSYLCQTCGKIIEKQVFGTKTMFQGALYCMGCSHRLNPIFGSHGSNNDLKKKALDMFCYLCFVIISEKPVVDPKLQKCDKPLCVVCTKKWEDGLSHGNGVADALHEIETVRNKKLGK